MDIRGVHEARRIGLGRIEGALLALNAGEIAREPIGPLARFRWGEPNQKLPASDPKARHEVGVKSR